MVHNQTSRQLGILCNTRGGTFQLVLTNIGSGFLLCQSIRIFTTIPLPNVQRTLKPERKFFERGSSPATCSVDGSFLTLTFLSSSDIFVQEASLNQWMVQFVWRLSDIQLSGLNINIYKKSYYGRHSHRCAPHTLNTDRSLNSRIFFNLFYQQNAVFKFQHMYLSSLCIWVSQIFGPMFPLFCKELEASSQSRDPGDPSQEPVPAEGPGEDVPGRCS